MKTSVLDPVAVSEDHLGLIDVDYVEMWVGNALQAAHYYQSVFGFSISAFKGLETGSRDVSSYLLTQNNIRLIITSSLDPLGEVANHVQKHGDSVKDIALRVKDIQIAYSETIARGATGVRPISIIEDEYGVIKSAAIATYGDVIHSFVQRDEYEGPFLPGFQSFASTLEAVPTGLQYVDHGVGNVGLGDMETWVAFYRDVLGFTEYIHFDDDDISTEYSALMSKVMSGGRGHIKFPINEPAEGLKKSQIDEYLEYNQGPGVQHLALLTEDIVATVKELRSRGLSFLRVPTTYYDALEERVGKIDENMEDLKDLGILVDRDDEGYLLQIFSRPVTDRPTLFFEIIQRKGARGFGKGNFKALFEAIEREQDLRGNL